jgi:hypothetical protein
MYPIFLWEPKLQENFKRSFGCHVKKVHKFQMTSCLMYSFKIMDVPNSFVPNGTKRYFLSDHIPQNSKAFPLVKRTPKNLNSRLQELKHSLLVPTITPITKWCRLFFCDSCLWSPSYPMSQNDLWLVLFDEAINYRYIFARHNQNIWISNKHNKEKFIWILIFLIFCRVHIFWRHGSPDK